MIKKILNSTAIAFLANIDGCISLLQRIEDGQKIKSMNITLQVLGLVTTFILAFVILNQVYKLKKELMIVNFISYQRGKKLFINQYKDIQYPKLPDESDFEYWQRIPNGGMYIEYLNREKEDVNKLIDQNFKNITTSEKESILNKYYPKIKVNQ